ncbi:MAG: hypothetical protein LBL44_08535, partial [Treponema sp.]|nr:hypothetical protein [Treponema sp.]
MRRPTLYKHRGTWYARIWDTGDKKYRSHSLKIPVEGKRERRREAEEAARILAERLAEEAVRLAEEKREAEQAGQSNPLAGAPLIPYLENFWQADSEYAKEKALVEQSPVSAHYLLSNRQLVKNKAAPFPGFAGVTLGGLTKAMLRQWKLWMAENGTSGRMINGALLALRVPVRRAFNDDLIPADPFAGVA